MPVIPGMDIVQSPVGVPRGPRESGYGELAQGLGKAAELVGGLQAAQRKQELQSFDADIWTRMDTEHKKLLSESEAITDAGQYQATVNKGSQEIYKQLQKDAKGDPDKQAIIQKRYGDTLRAITDNIGAGVVARRKSTTEANLSRFAEFTTDSLMDETDPNVVRERMADFHKSVNEAPYIKDEEKQKTWEKFKKDLPYQWLAHQAKDPDTFLKRYERKEFDGLADTTSLDKAVDLATRLGDLRARRDEREGKAQSEAAERQFEEDASNRKLNVGELNLAAKRYGWDKNKVDGLLKMQLGLKVANPYEKLLIEDAMLPADKNATYTLGDVTEAEKNLKNLAKQGLTDVRTEEYRAAMRRLQGMRGRLDVTSDVKERQSSFDARQAIHDMYNEFLPGNNRPAVIAEKNANLGKLEGMSAQERRKFVDDLRKEFERKKQENQGPQINRETLRGLKVK